ncbi:MAG TPA: thioredoxin family protein [Bacteroidales bacterium]|nr:thioredoxin family protein [Bacteroidales bacterium]
MKKLIITSFLLLVVLGFNNAQQAKPTIYNPDANAKADINAAVSKAAAENKHVLIQVGGNWCSWCLKFHKLLHTDATIDSVLKADYVFILVNYSKENKNLPVLKEFDFPQRFGFPVLLVLDKSGKLIHTQDSGLLEAGDGYDTKKVIGFLKGWNVAALDPKNY